MARDGLSDEMLVAMNRADIARERRIWKDRRNAKMLTARRLGASHIEVRGPNYDTWTPDAALMAKILAAPDPEARAIAEAARSYYSWRGEWTENPPN